jgi:putative membrane protein
MHLGIFGFRALWSPYFLLVMVLFSMCYFYIVTKRRGNFEDSQPITRSESFLFILVMFLIYVIKGSPIDLLGHIMFYVHMIQMALLYLVVPPLLIIAVPNWVWKRIISVNWIGKFFYFFTKPILALLLFNVIFSLYHVPTVFDVVKVNAFSHGGYTIVLFILSMFMWWPLMNKIEDQHQLNGLKKVGYLFANGMLLTPACALIIFAEHPIYLTYSDPSHWMKAMSLCVPSGTLQSLSGITGPELFSHLPVVEDQQLGGVIMKIMQEIVFGVILARIFVEWFRNEQRDNDVITAKALHKHQMDSIKS